MSIGDGIKIKIKFTQPLLGFENGVKLTGEEAKFKVYFARYEYVPEGKIIRAAREVESVEVVDEYTVLLNLKRGNINSIQNSIGDVIVFYDGSGTLAGLGGPVAAFEKAFTPKELDYKENQNDAEHIELIDVIVKQNLMKIFYKNFDSKAEHLEIVGVTASATLINVDDI